MHPILFEIGDFPVGTYALMALLGLSAGVFVFSWLGHRGGHERFSFVEMGLWAFIIAILSSKAFGVLLDVDLSDLKGSLRDALRFSGHFYVGFLAGTAYLIFAFRKSAVPLGRGLDYLAPALALAHAIGRLGCLAAGCCWGKACDLPWALTFTNERAHEITGVPLGVPLHPTQLYEAGIELVLFAVLLCWHLLRPGFAGSTFLRYVVLYGIARFALETVRDDPNRGRFMETALSTSQGLAVVSVVAAVAAFAWLWRRAREDGGAAGRTRESGARA